MPDTILIIDDQQHIIDSLELLLATEGFETQTASSPAQVKSLLAKHQPDLVLMDMNFSLDTTSGKEGLALVQDIRSLNGLLPVVVMTAWASIELSVKAMQLGANDFIEKPWRNRRLLSLLNGQLALYREKQKNQSLKALVTQSQQALPFVGDSPAMEQVLRLIERTAKSDANILLTGESGVGKSMIASYIHNSSLRKEQSFVSVNMGALTDTLFSSELFGHTKGAFTDAKAQRIGRFEMAEGGTLFMDEIANIPLEQQARLLRVLESGEFEALGSSRTQTANVRIISATNDDLMERVDAGQFRQDLMYRLNTITIEIPPLRHRQPDIPLLAAHFLQRFSQKYHRPGLSFSELTLAEMQNYSWPGNVRELAHGIERGVLVCTSEQIVPADLGLQSQKSLTSFDGMTLEEVEKAMLINALQKHQHNIVSAAQELGISRNALYRRMEKHHIKPAIDHDAQ